MELKLPACPTCGVSATIEQYASEDLPTRLLGTNDEPLPTEEAFLFDSLEDTEHDLASLDAAALHLKTLLRSVEKRRRQVQGTRGLIRALLSPVRRVPTEIWQQIIRFALESNTVYLAFHKPWTSRIPGEIWAFAQVSRAWRSAVLALPSLWSNIHIQYNKGSDVLLKHQGPRILGVVLSRAKTRPLTLNFDVSSTSTVARDLLRQIVFKSRLWKSVKIRAPPSLLRELGKVKDKLPILESLEIHHYQQMESTTIQPIRSAFRTAPALRSVILGHFVNVQNLSLPWSQITYFEESTYSTAQEVLQLLHQLPNLATYTLRCDSLITATPPSPVTLHNLRSLRVEDGTLLPYLLVPGLKELVLSSCTVATYRAVLAFLQASACQIEKLTWIEHGGMRLENPLDPVVKILFAEMPTLTTLTLPNTIGPHSPSFLSLLKFEPQPDNHAVVLPNLETLKLHWEYFQNNASPLVAMIESRSTAAPLKEVCCLKKNALSDGMMSQLEGKGVKVTTSPVW